MDMLNRMYWMRGDKVITMFFFEIKHFEIGMFTLGPFITFLNSKRFWHNCPCSTFRDWFAVYLTLLLSKLIIDDY